MKSGNYLWSTKKKRAISAVLSEINPVDALPCFMVHFNIILQVMPRFFKWYLSFSFPHQNSVYISLLPMRAICPTHLTQLDVISLVIFGEQLKSWSFSLCSLLQSPVTSFLSTTNTSPQHPVLPIHPSHPVLPIHPSHPVLPIHPPAPCSPNTSLSTLFSLSLSLSLEHPQPMFFP